MEMKDTVCAVVVTYNRKNLLIECLEAIRKQTRPVQGIYLIDNASEDGTPELLLEKGYISELPPQNIKEPWEMEFIIPNLIDGSSIKFHYVRMHENTGGAGGFHEGVKRAYEKGYDWLWLMDDDAEPSLDCLKILLLEKDENCVVLCPRIKGRDGYQDYHHKRLSKFTFKEKKWNIDAEGNNKIEIDGNAFVGPLIKTDAIRKVGYPFKDFFIWYDDTEYIFRLKKVGRVYLIKTAIINHKDVKPKNINELESLKGIMWRNYYGIRNYIIFAKMHIPKKYFLIGIGLHILQSFRIFLSYMIKYRLKLKTCLIPIKGIIDGFQKKLGKTLDIGEIYVERK